MGFYPLDRDAKVEIPQPGGGKRLLGIPTVMDRVIQQAIAQVLAPIFDPPLSESSFGFRPGCNAHQAIRQVQASVKEGRNTAVDTKKVRQRLLSLTGAARKQTIVEIIQAPELNNSSLS